MQWSSRASGLWEKSFQGVGGSGLLTGPAPITIRPQASQSHLGRGKGNAFPSAGTLVSTATVNRGHVATAIAG
jgi:hypothetical protein